MDNGGQQVTTIFGKILAEMHLRQRWTTVDNGGQQVTTGNNRIHGIGIDVTNSPAVTYGDFIASGSYLTVI